MKLDKKNFSPAIIIILLVVAAAAFFGGIKYQEKKSRDRFTGAGQFGQFGGQRNQRSSTGGQGGRMMGRGVMGEVISSDDHSITVKMLDGSSKIAIIDEKTSINKAAEGSKADLTQGTRVAVFGTANSDGSETAQNIQINPIMRIQGTPTIQDK